MMPQIVEPQVPRDRARPRLHPACVAPRNTASSFALEPRDVHQHGLRAGLPASSEMSRGLLVRSVNGGSSDRRRLHLPDVPCVLRDRPIARELAGGRHVQDGLALEQDPAVPRDRRAILAPWLNRLRSPARFLRTVQTCRLWTEPETIGGIVHALRLLISARRAARVVG